MSPFPLTWQREQRSAKDPRRGIFLVLALVAMTIVLAFAALSVDFGRLVMVRQEMQNAVDAAALAAAMEITAAVETAGPDVSDVVAYAKQQARLKAAYVAQLNGVFVDPDQDVEFGRRSYNPATQKFETTWNVPVANVVRVTARREHADRSRPDGMVHLPFAQAIGRGSQPLRTIAAAFVESRDIACVIDFSRSMNFDSYFASEYTAGVTMPHNQIRANIRKVWDDLGNPTWGNMQWEPTWVTIPSTTWGSGVWVRWENTSVFINGGSNFNQVILTFNNGATQTFTPSTPSGTWAGTGSNSGRQIARVSIRKNTISELFNFYDDKHIRRGLGLTNVSYPWPSGSWEAFFSMVRSTQSGTASSTNLSASPLYCPKIQQNGFRCKFGIMTLLNYQMRHNARYDQTPVWWRTRHYPFHSVKLGQQMLCNFLEELSFNDYVGFVSYDTHHRIEQVLNQPGAPAVNISSKPLTNNYQAIRDLIHYRQAAHYFPATNIGGGLKSAKLLLDTHGRPGARPTILLMTDGQSNTMDAGETGNLPADWNWNTLFDYNGDGFADYTTSSTHKCHVLRRAKECVDAGYTIHTMSVGVDADRDLMRAIAFLGRGVYIDVPVGATVEDIEADVIEAFYRIASFVPPARLMSEE